jgi:murein DD-endopeptidase MepM/ murein hydrolase activator NlpD
MPTVVAPFSAQIASRCAVLALLSTGVAGCSTDVSRFSDPNANPFAYTNTTTPPGEMTGSLHQGSAAPSGKVTSQPLPTYDGAQGGYQQQSQQQYGNALPAPPRRDYRSSAAPAPAPVREAAAARSAPTAGVHVVSSGDTLGSIGRRYGKPRGEIARANKLPIDAKVRIGQRLTIPGAGNVPVRVAAATPKPTASQPAQRGAPERNLAPPPVSSSFKPAASKVASTPMAPVRTATAEPTATARIATPTPEAAAEAAAEAPSATGSTPTFRWPARGRVIAGFGPKPNGQQNDGINLAVPEGTSIKAAEDGVVAYAGNELKGYGNLVLVRHSNGYVTAYAHASELTVKRGETIKRGQIIAKAGQTGGVNSPQLHFEIRKGSSPVDPMQYLAGS